MKYPIIIIKDKEAPIFVFKKNEFGLISKGGDTFYKKGTLYDSEGSVFDVRGVANIRKASFLQSIKFIQRMYIVEPILVKTKEITVDSLKEIIVAHIENHKTYWESKDEINSLIKYLKGFKTYEALITFIK